MADAAAPMDRMHLVPSGDWALDMERRVLALEGELDAALEALAKTPAADALGSEALQQLHERLDRHRVDIDEVKGLLNGVVRFVKQAIPAPGSAL